MSKTYTVKYWATVYREVEFTADDIDHANELADNFPEQSLPDQVETHRSIEERDNFEVEPKED